MSTVSLVFLVLVSLATIGIGLQQRHRVEVKLTDPLGGHINDFDRWMIMLPHFIHDQADYVDDLFPTPPLSMIILAPMTVLSRPNAQFAWVCLKLPVACLAFLITMAIVTRSGERLGWSATSLILAGWWLPTALDMQQGQINFIVLLPLLVALYLVQNETVRSDLGAGGLIGLAAAIKVTPLVFAGYFFWKRRWMVGVSALVGLGVLTFIVPSVVFGWDQNGLWLTQWIQIMIVPYVTRREVLYPVSQSFGSFALRLLSPIPVFETSEDGVPYGHYMNVANLSEQVVSQIVLAVMIVVAFLGLVWTRRRLETFRCRRYLLEIAAVTAFMLWFSERTWVHHYVSFIITLAAGGAVLSNSATPVRRRRLIRNAMTTFAVMTLLVSEAGRVFGPNGVDWAKGAGVFLWPSIFVTTVTISARC